MIDNDLVNQLSSKKTYGITYYDKQGKDVYRHTSQGQRTALSKMKHLMTGYQNKSLKEI